MAEKGQGMLLKAQGRTLSTFREDTEREWKAPFYFIQGADPQFGLMKAYAIGDCGSDGDEWGEELRLMQQAVLAINKLNPKPRFFILCGDLIHGMPGNDCSKLCESSLGIQNLSDQEAKHFMWFLSPRTDLFLEFLKLCKALERGTPWREAQECDLKNTLKDVSSNIPVIFVSGNHDLGNTPTPETIDDYCQQWGDDYFSFWAGGVFFLVLNSQLFFDHSKCPELKRAQDAWLLEQLAVAEERKCKHAVVFQHIPLFLQTPDEENDYFNLEKSVRQDLLEKFHKAGIKVVFSGHYHRNAGGTYKDLEMVVSSAIGCQLGEDTHGLRMVVVTAEKIVHRYYSLSQLSDQGLDKDLMDLLK